MNTRNMLRKIRDHDFTKELRDFEYETKFDVRNTRAGALGILKKVRTCFLEGDRFVLCAMKQGDKLVTRASFFTAHRVEYSLFSYRGVRMVKIKKHTILEQSPFPIFKNNEQMVIDRTDFTKKFAAIGYRFRRHKYRLVDLDAYLEKKKFSSIGDMIKTRVKDFVFGTRDGRIYAVAVTFCTSAHRIQKQLEVEYAGFLPGFRKTKLQSERAVIAGVEEVSRAIYQRWTSMLRPSRERKFDFVKRVRSNI